MEVVEKQPMEHMDGDQQGEAEAEAEGGGAAEAAVAQGGARRSNFRRAKE